MKTTLALLVAWIAGIAVSELVRVEPDVYFQVQIIEENGSPCVALNGMLKRPETEIHVKEMTFDCKGTIKVKADTKPFDTKIAFPSPTPAP